MAISVGLRSCFGVCVIWNGCSGSQSIDPAWMSNVQVSFLYFSNSVTRLGDILHFGQTFKAGGNNYFTQIAHIVRQFL